jgi:energy-coupling factor transport system permease protein
MGAIFLSILLVAFLSKTLKGTLGFIRPFAVLILFIVVVWVFLFPGTTQIYEISISTLTLRITLESLLHGFGVALRFLSLLAATYVLIATTRIGDIVLATQKLGIPYTVGFLFAGTIRFLPVILDEFNTIADAQRSRGVDIGGSNVITRARRIMVVLVPLLVSSFKRVKLVGWALQTRAFGATAHRTFLRDLRAGYGDYLTLAINMVALGVCVWLKLHGFGVVGGANGLFPGVVSS